MTASPNLPSAPLLGQSLPTLTDWVLAQGQPRYRGQQLHQWLYTRGARSLQEIHRLS
jgi:23S rRNA (adenine2503-C2)-methyltransferase